MLRRRSGVIAAAGLSGTILETGAISATANDIAAITSGGPALPTVHDAFADLSAAAAITHDLTFTITVGATKLVALLGTDGTIATDPVEANSTINSAIWDPGGTAQNLTRRVAAIDRNGVSFNRSECWDLENPTPITNGILRVTVARSMSLGAIIGTVKGAAASAGGNPITVDSTSPQSPPAGATSMSTNIDPAPNSLIIDRVTLTDAGIDGTPGGSQNELFDSRAVPPTGALRNLVSTVESVSGAATNMSWTFSASVSYAHVIASYGPSSLLSTTPGALPAYGSAGTALATATLAATHIPVRPAIVASGDLLICSAFGRHGSGSGVVTLAMHANMTADGWQHVGASPYINVTEDQGHLVAWKIATAADAANQGLAIPGGIVAGGSATSDGLYARIFRFTAADGFHTSPIVNAVAKDLNDVSNTSIAMPDVTPTGNNQLAVAIVGHTANVTVAAATGETGGDWIENVDGASATAVAGIQIQTSGQSGGGAITGGTATASANCIAIAIGFAMKPAYITPLFVNDTFTEATDTLLSSHTAELGGQWVFQGGTGTAEVTGNAVLAVSGSSSYYSPAVPPSAVYEAEAVLVSKGQGGAGLCVRMNPSANTHYRLNYDGSDDTWKIRKSIAGVDTMIASHGPVTTIPIDQQYNMRFQVSGTNPVVLMAWIDGVEIITFSDSATDRIAATGHAGIFTNTTAADLIASFQARG
jgi:hypothetical protein